MAPEAPRVAFVRGEALNPFETQVLRGLTDFDITLVGRQDPPYQLEHIGVPVVLLRSRAQRFRAVPLVALRRLQRADLADLEGLAEAVAGADVLHGAETFIPWTAQLAQIKRRTGARLVTTCWETIPFAHDDDERLSARKREVKQMVDLFLCTTQLSQKALLSEGVELSRTTVVSPGVDTDRFRPSVRGGQSRPLVILLPGRAIREKGGINLLLACARLPAALRCDLVLRITGSGPETGRLATAGKSLGISHLLRFTSELTYQEMPREYARADVVAVPSLTTPYWEEQFGMVLAEAMACGLPILATASGAVPEVVGDAAVVVPPYSVEALTAALTSLLEDDELRRDLGRRARARALDRFSISTSARALALSYRQVLG